MENHSSPSTVQLKLSLHLEGLWLKNRNSQGCWLTFSLLSALLCSSRRFWHSLLPVVLGTVNLEVRRAVDCWMMIEVAMANIGHADLVLVVVRLDAKTTMGFSVQAKTTKGVDPKAILEEDRALGKRAANTVRSVAVDPDRRNEVAVEDDQIISNQYHAKVSAR